MDLIIVFQGTKTGHQRPPIAEGPQAQVDLKNALPFGLNGLVDGLHHLRDAEVQQLRMAVPVDQDVIGLQVVMNDALLVRSRDAAAHGIEAIEALELAVEPVETEGDEGDPA